MKRNGGKPEHMDKNKESGKNMKKWIEKLFQTNIFRKPRIVN